MTYIIAEIGNNHEGSFKLAKKLIDSAKKSGADYVKFQTYKTEKLLNKKVKLANYQKKNTSYKNLYLSSFTPVKISVMGI